MSELPAYRTGRHPIPLKTFKFNWMKFKWLNASKILVFGGLKNHRTPVRLSSTPDKP